MPCNRWRSSAQPVQCSMHERGCVPGLGLGASCTPAALATPSSPLGNPRPPKASISASVHTISASVHSASRTRRPSLNANVTKQLWHCVAHIALQALQGHSGSCHSLQPAPATAASLAIAPPSTASARAVCRVVCRRKQRSGSNSASSHGSRLCEREWPGELAARPASRVVAAAPFPLRRGAIRARRRWTAGGCAASTAPFTARLGVSSQR